MPNRKYRERNDLAAVPNLYLGAFADGSNSQSGPGPRIGIV